MVYQDNTSVINNNDYTFEIAQNITPVVFTSCKLTVLDCSYMTAEEWNNLIASIDELN